MLSMFQMFTFGHVEPLESHIDWKYVLLFSYMVLDNHSLVN